MTLNISKEPQASYPGDRSTVNKLLPVFGTTAIEDIMPRMTKAYLDTADDLTKTQLRTGNTLDDLSREREENPKLF